MSIHTEWAQNKCHNLFESAVEEFYQLKYIYAFREDFLKKKPNFLMKVWYQRLNDFNDFSFPSLRLINYT